MSPICTRPILRLADAKLAEALASAAAKSFDRAIWKTA